MNKTYKDMTDEEAYNFFKEKYTSCRYETDYMIARVLSGRLRDLDKRTKKANERADKAEAELAQIKAQEPVGYQQILAGEWMQCSEFVAKGWSDNIDKDCRAIYATPVANPRQVSDGEINEITMNTIGIWPSFEAQSWACKVVHAVQTRAAPVGQTAEIDRLREALKLIASETAGLDLHDARDISRAALSGKEPK